MIHTSSSSKSPRPSPHVAAHARLLAHLHQDLLPFGWSLSGWQEATASAASAMGPASVSMAHGLMLDLPKDEQTLLQNWQDDFEHHFASLSAKKTHASELLHHAHQEPESFWGQMMESCRLAAVALFFEDDEATLISEAWMRSCARLGHFDARTWPDRWEDFSTMPLPQPSHPLPALGLYPVLPDAQWVNKMVDVGLPTVQLRFKSEDRQAIEREVKAAVRATESSKTRLFINDHWEVAMDAGAYGLHLGQEDFAVAPMEKIRQSPCVLGLSTHGYVEMLHAAKHAPGYLALGAVFPTTLKQMKTKPQGLGRLKAYASLMKPFSLVGIGGIDESQFKAVQACGVGSIAVVRAIVAHPEPEAQARHLMAYF